MADNELGLFLRDRRESLTPADVGLPAGPRRRAPGLRRAEVAALAGVSVEYVIRLEQGRDRRPSSPVLSSLADALRLTTSQRVHLHRLAKAADGGFRCKGNLTTPPVVRPTVRALLTALEPVPAVLLDPSSDVLAHTAGYERVFGPIGLLDAAPPNLVRFVFVDDRARDAFPDWERVADEQIAALKQGPFRVDQRIARLADELTVAAGTTFTDRIDAVSGLAKPTGVMRLVHPHVGEVRLAYETLDLPADDDQRLLVHFPADASTSAALDRLSYPSAPLRLVSG